MLQQNVALITYAISAWGVRPTCQSLKCDVMAVGTYGITAIDCDLLPDVLHMQFFGHRRLLALQVTTPINVMSRPLVLTDTTRLSCQAKKLVYIS